MMRNLVTGPHRVDPTPDHVVYHDERLQTFRRGGYRRFTDVRKRGTLTDVQGFRGTGRPHSAEEPSSEGQQDRPPSEASYPCREQCRDIGSQSAA